MIELPTGRQTFDFDCGATALQIVMAYYGVDIRKDELMEELKVDADGVSVQNMISVARAKGFRVIGKCDFSPEEMKRFVDARHPVVVVVQAWAEGFMTLEDWRDENNNGHYVIVIAHNDGVIVFEDPASFRKTWMTEEEFMARWHDVDPRTGQKMDRVGLVLLGKNPMPLHKTFEHMD